MNTYQYKVRDKFGTLSRGIMEADSEGGVASKLKEAGYAPLSIVPEQNTHGLSAFLGRFNRPSNSEITMFIRQFAAMQKSGIPLLLSVRTLGQESANARLKSLVVQVGRDIEAGSSLSAAFSRHSAVFNPLYINLIKTGEATGRIGSALERVADLGEYEEQIRMRIQSATRYPLIVLVSILVGFFLLTALVVPRFAAMYSQFNVALPLPTRILLLIHFLLTRYWWALCAGVLAVWFGFTRLVRTKQGRLFWDRMRLRIPVFGPLVLKLIMARFTRITGSLMQAGVGLFDVLTMAAGGLGNLAVAADIEVIRRGVTEGKGLSGPMRSCGVFPPVVVQMVAIGEQTGKLDELLLRVSDYYDAQVKHAVDNLTALIEPFLIFVLGGAVLFMALGIFLPLWSMMNLFKH